MSEYRGAGFAIPQVFPDGPVDLEEVRAVAQRAEALGYDSLWTQERIAGRSVVLEPVTLLAYLAAITERPRLGVSIIVLPLRNPVQLAKSLATLDILSRGRLTAGLGLGGASERQFAAFGVPPERRVRRFTESIQVIDALWREDEAHVEGEFFHLDGLAMEPKPVQRPRPPIWFGARSEPALRRAVRYGEGWMGAGSSSTDDFRAQLASIRQFLEQAGRDPATFTISKRVYIAIDDDADRAERRLRDWFGEHYNNADMASAVAVWGPAERCYERIDEIIDAGAQHLLLNPAFDYDEHLDALARYTRSTEATPER